MLSRLKTGRGETLAETLVALLISAISLIMFAQMLSPAVNLAETGESWNAAVNALNTFLEKKPSDLESLADSGVTPDTGTISIQTESGEKLITDIDVTLYIADADKYSGEQVISYGMP